MASEYLKWKYRDVKPREKVELTPEEKRKNWWYYHKWHVAAAVVGVILCVFLIRDMLGVGRVKPDYQIAYVGSDLLPDDTGAALEAGLAALGEDLNGDGVVKVTVNQYAMDTADPQMGMAVQVRLMADLTEGESLFFLLEDPKQFQLNYHILCRLDGTLPEAGDESVDGICLKWEQCPALAGMDLGEFSYEMLGSEVTGDSNELMSGLFLGRREFSEEYETLWAAMTNGAAQ